MTMPPVTPNPIGFPIQRGQVDTQIGNISRNIETWAEQAINFWGWIQYIPDEELSQPPYNYSVDDVPKLKSGALDLFNLAQIYKGQQTLDTATDFGRFTRAFSGLFLT